MRVFISSVISGFEAERDAAVDAIETLGFTPVRAEDFGASDRPPQAVCLEGVRSADVVVVILGSRYGAVQPTGLSPTHEEYREARDRRSTLVFVQTGAEPEEQQQAFIEEAQAWVGGRYVGFFDTPADLKKKLIQALHRTQIERQIGSADDGGLAQRALDLIPKDSRRNEDSLCVAVASGPEQPVIRPAHLERKSFHEELQQAAQFGSVRIFSTSEATAVRVQDHALVLEQDTAQLQVDELGNVAIELSLAGQSGWSMAIIEEDVHDRLSRAIAFAGIMLDMIDPELRVGRVGIAAGIVGRHLGGWQKRDDLQGPYAGRIVRGFGSDGPVVVQPAPPTRPRAALLQQTEELAEDLLTLIRRKFTSV